MIGEYARDVGRMDVDVNRRPINIISFYLDNHQQLPTIQKARDHAGTSSLTRCFGSGSIPLCH